MGYTHYWDQKRNFTVSEWKTVTEDVQAILKYAQHEDGIALANGRGDGGTSPVFNTKYIAFNGVGDDSHETLLINRIVPKAKYPGDSNPSWDFCKTARKPYDSAVTAVLCYLSTVTRKDDPKTGEPIVGTEAYSVSSDGSGSDFIAGLELARKALPRNANQLDIPMAIMQSDRWCAPWIRVSDGVDYEVHFCVDGKGYVLHGNESYCFTSHMELAHFLEKTKCAMFRKGGKTDWGSYPAVEENIWSATGCFDVARHTRIGVAQRRVLEKLFPVDEAHDKHPPAYVRPGEMPDNSGRPFCYSVADLMKLAANPTAA